MKLKIGDVLECINVNKSNNLVLGFGYKIRDINQYGNIQVRQFEYGLDDEYVLPHYYKPDRFKLVQSAKTDKKRSQFDPKKKYRTKDGSEFHFIGMTREKTFPVVGEYLYEGDWQQSNWTLEGKYYDEYDSDNDLVEIPESIKLNFGGIDIEVFDDLSMTLEDARGQEVLSFKASNEEIDNLISALQTFRKNP